MNDHEQWRGIGLLRGISVGSTLVGAVTIGGCGGHPEIPLEITKEKPGIMEQSASPSVSSETGTTRDPTQSPDSLIEAKIIEIVAEQMGVDKSEITRETSFSNDLNADSLDLVELIMEFEDEFEISIPDEDVEALNTVGEVITYIKSRGSSS